jgi:hypothetical protein
VPKPYDDLQRHAYEKILDHPLGISSFLIQGITAGFMGNNIDDRGGIGIFLTSSFKGID